MKAFLASPFSNFANNGFFLKRKFNSRKKGKKWLFSDHKPGLVILLNEYI